MALSNVNNSMLALMVILLSACASTPIKVIFDETNPTMESILHGNAKSELTFSERAVGRAESRAHNGAINSTQPVFRELENPTLFLYIEPHVTEGGTYLPGMTVPYKQYNKVEFALPGEL